MMTKENIINSRDLCSGGSIHKYLNNGDPHEFQESFAVVIVLFCHLEREREIINVLIRVLDSVALNWMILKRGI